MRLDGLRALISLLFAPLRIEVGGTNLSISISSPSIIALACLLRVKVQRAGPAPRRPGLQSQGLYVTLSVSLTLSLSPPSIIVITITIIILLAPRHGYAQLSIVLSYCACVTYLILTARGMMLAAASSIAFLPLRHCQMFSWLTLLRLQT